MGIRIKIRRDTSSNWQTINPILAEGEIGYELDTGRLKIGNGSSHWSDLPYIIGEPVPQGFNFNDVTDKVNVDNVTIEKNSSNQLQVKDGVFAKLSDVEELAIIYSLIF